MPGRATPAMPAVVVAARQQRVDERPLPVAGRRMDHEARGLVDDQQVIVLVHDRQGDRRVGLQMVRDLGRRDLEGHAAAELHAALQARGESVTLYHGRLSKAERHKANQDRFMAEPSA